MCFKYRYFSDFFVPVAWTVVFNSWKTPPDCGISYNKLVADCRYLTEETENFKQWILICYSFNNLKLEIIFTCMIFLHFILPKFWDWQKCYTGCPRRNGQNFGRVFLMLNYTDITQNTYIQSWTVTEIMAREVWNFNSCYTLIDYQIHIKTGRNMWFL